MVELDSGDELAARTVVLATGASYRQLPVDGLRAAERRGRLLRGDPGRGADVRLGVGGGGRRRQLGRAGGDLPLRLRPNGFRCSCAAATSARRCRTTWSSRSRRSRTSTSCATPRCARSTARRRSPGWTVEETGSGERRDLDVGGLFIFIGADPCTEWLGRGAGQGRRRLPADRRRSRSRPPRRRHRHGRPRGASPGDQPSRRLRGRRRPLRLDQAGRLGGRRGLDVRPPRPPIPPDAGPATTGPALMGRKLAYMSSFRPING